MSKHNKVNPGQYHVAGRLTPDEAARERVKQRNVADQVGGGAPDEPQGGPVQAEGAREKGAAGVDSMLPGKDKGKSRTAGR